MGSYGSDADELEPVGKILIKGVVSSGLGEGRFFTELPWVRSQFIAKLGIDPYPGTFNVTVESPDDLSRALRSYANQSVEIVPESPEFCCGVCYSVVIEGRVRGAAVLPKVGGYPKDKLEIVAGVMVKEELGLVDGDKVTIAFIPRAARQGNGE